MRLDAGMSEGNSGNRLALAAHIAPFAAWLVIMTLLGDPAGWKYGVRSATCLVLLIALRPWRWYSGPRWRNVPMAIATGVVVFLVWIAGETNLAARLPALQDLYLLVGTLPPWKPLEIVSGSAYDPAVCGWAWTTTRILGSAFVIAVIEEFFWRGFLYRWLINQDFLDVDTGLMHTAFFWVVALAFALEHTRWLAGLAAGLAYGWLFVRTRDIWAAATAHVVTNLLLGLYVVWSAKYHFWG